MALTYDLCAHATRGLVLSIAGLAWHGLGIDAGCSREKVARVLNYLRIREPMTRSELLRGAHLEKRERDLLVECLTAESTSGTAEPLGEGGGQETVGGLTVGVRFVGRNVFVSGPASHPVGRISHRQSEAKSPAGERFAVNTRPELAFFHCGTRRRHPDEFKIDADSTDTGCTAPTGSLRGLTS
jgi:hypothetical protein